MGISRTSAMMIQDNEVACHSIGPLSNGKYGYSIWLLKNSRYHTPILSLDQGTYDTSSQAVRAAEALVEEIKAMDLEAVRSE